MGSPPRQWQSPPGLSLWQAIAVLRNGTVRGPHFTWLDLSAFTLEVGVFADPMGAILAVLVCLLATAVLLFNRWYMHDDPLAGRFPWQFCGFLFAMLGVVLSDNLFLSFCCWELVGLGSYLLIGFWFDKPAAADDPDYQARKGANARGVAEATLSPAHAQLKAFVINRVGDAGFLLGIGALLCLALANGGTGNVLGFDQLATLQPAEVTFLGLSGTMLLTLAALGVFCGAIGKSAQFPLHTWLPDAMQGPTTASSIIHAATMVAAGVFLVARCLPFFPPEALTVVGCLGGITCLLAAVIACVQWDLKAVLAYSTISQLGLMFVGLGAGTAAGGQAAALAHLFTHALFKCLLFLGAGAVIHACHGHQDLHRLGGLRKAMPVTAMTSLLAVLAIAGVPLFSGFYSKDAVLAAALLHAQTNGGLAWAPLLLAAAGSLLTAGYMLRWWLRIFALRARQSGITDHAHDPEGAAKWVLMLLATGTLALPFTAGDWLDHALLAPHDEHHHAAHSTAMVLALGLLAVGAATAWWIWFRAPRRQQDLAGMLAQRLATLHRAAAELFWLDALQARLFGRTLGRDLAATTARLDLGSRARIERLEHDRAPAELTSLDGLIDGIGRGCAGLGAGAATAHSGRIGVYLALAALLSTAALLVLVLR
ncbi:MAG: NADH-quinone oxidoreductase subunit L [Planctomycetes bacterium]|nr:NADH-quinone oxidoreductase subunit L [Planctomycetota bacterium]